MLDAADPTRVVGVLDWEMATVGDPLMDLSGVLAYWVEAGDSAFMQRFRRQPTTAPGMWTRDRVVSYYAERTGFELTPERLALLRGLRAVPAGGHRPADLLPLRPRPDHQRGLRHLRTGRRRPRGPLPVAGDRLMGHLLLVRHGQASFGADDYDVLSERGWAQARLLGTWLPSRTSPRPRWCGAPCAATARRSRRWSRPPAGPGSSARVDPGWDEFDHLGIVASYPDLPDGDSTLALSSGSSSGPRRAGSRGADGYPETYAGFVARVRAALDRAGQGAGPSGPVVVVSSGGPIAAACAALVDPDGDDAARARVWQRLNTVTVNSSVTRVLVGSTGPRLLTFNEHSHLSADTVTYR